VKRRYQNEAVVRESGGVQGAGIFSVLIFSVTTLYLTENLWASALLFVFGTLVANGGLIEILYLTKRGKQTSRKGSTHPLPKNFVTPYEEDE
jgi:hypothetical protein